MTSHLFLKPQHISKTLAHRIESRHTEIEKMPISFLDLPGEIRNEIYKHCLVRDKPITPWKGAKYGLSTEILYLNSQLHHEAVYMLYALNSFNLVRRGADVWDHRVMSWFLGTIGSKNASLLRSIQINYPRVWCYKSETKGRTLMIVEDHSRENYQMIQKSCPDLRTIKIPLGTARFWEGTSRYPWYNYLVPPLPNTPGPYVAFVDSHFRGIAKDIVLEVYKEDLEVEEGWYKEIMMEMQNFGWILTATEMPEPKSPGGESLYVADEDCVKYNDFGVEDTWISESDFQAIVEKTGRIDLGEV